MAKEKTDPSKVEIIKQNSKLLRGTIDETLKDESLDCFTEADLQVLKFHGTYQQDDRDLRKPRRAEGLGKAYSMMIRIALPGGELTKDQYVEVDRMADQFGKGSIRITTRQAIQYHGILKGELRETLRQVNEAMMTTLGGCGDICRNVMATAAPFKDAAHETIRKTARDIAVHMRPASNAYYELWIDGKKEVSTEDQIAKNESEPFYGNTYLPKKYKVGVTLQGDNQIDVYSYDTGLIGVLDGDRLVGWNVVAGGGLGLSHGRPNTFAQVADKIGFIAIEDGVAAVEHVCSIYRDFGNRADRKQARLKYLIDKMGLNEFKAEFKKRCDFEVHPWRELPETIDQDWMGKHEQGDGKFFYGVFVENGRIKDTDTQKIRTAFLKVVQTLDCPVTLTAQQSIIFKDLTEAQIETLESILTEHNIPLLGKISNARRYSMACPAMPTCGLAVAESERFLPTFMNDIETKFEELGLEDAKLTIRMTGCPNGCARPYTADIAFVGRRPGVYHVFVGGRLAGDRMADLYAADVKQEEILTTLEALLKGYAQTRNENEGLGDFYQRILERTETRNRVTGKETPTLEEVQPKLVQLT